MTEKPNTQEPDAFALKIIEMQYNTIRAEIEFFLGKMYDVLRLSLATIPILAGALIALVADQSTWEMATQRPILLGLFCLLSPMFLVICVYLGNLGIAQYKSVTRAADYIKVHFEDYLFQPILKQLEKDKDAHVYREARFQDFLFWENYLSQHGFAPTDKRFRNTYDSDKHMMFAFLVFLTIAVVVISAICAAAFVALLWDSVALTSGVERTYQTVLFEMMLALSFVLFIGSLIWALVSFSAFFRTIRTTGALTPSIEGGSRP
jgi:hypothetical protein